jgi:2,3-bisphosphoglycerate-independent phosphoglycerate mutase
VLFFNFRADRARQLTQALTLGDTLFSKPPQLSWMITFTSYRGDFPVNVLLKKKPVHNTLFDVLEAHNVPLFTIAETEKYAHVTYFFNGGREVIRTNETRILIPSKRHYASYADYPAMSAPEITNTVLTTLDSNSHRFYLINYANADMVGHSGNLAATIEAIKILDYELGRLYKKIIEELRGTLYITADHGKAEDMWDSALAQPRTAHTTHTVPFLFLSNALPDQLPLRELEDVAPFILKNLELPVPSEMKRD